MTTAFNAMTARADGSGMSGSPFSTAARLSTAVLVAAALVGACSNERSSELRSLNPDDVATEPWDVIAVVVASDMRHSAVGPVFQRGTLSLVDGRPIEVTDTTARLDGCDGTDRQVDPTAAVTAYDYTDCLAFLSVDEDGDVTDAMMLAPLEGGATGDRWAITGDPVGIGSGGLLLRSRPTGDEMLFSLADGAEADLTTAVAGHTGSCAEGAELDAMSFYVDGAGEISEFAGYGAPIDGAFADDPCASVI